MSKIIKKKLKIDGMHWDLEDLTGIKSARTSYGKQECEVEFDEEQLSLEEVIKTIQKTGYGAQIKN